jgi:hypothetical protein
VLQEKFLTKLLQCSTPVGLLFITFALVGFELFYAAVSNVGV